MCLPTPLALFWQRANRVPWQPDWSIFVPVEGVLVLVSILLRGLLRRLFLSLAVGAGLRTVVAANDYRHDSPAF